MKLKELADILNKHIEENPQSAEYPVVVPVKITDKNMILGAYPSLDIKSCGEGFDWDSGRFMLWLNAEPQIPYQQYKKRNEVHEKK